MRSYKYFVPAIFLLIISQVAFSAADKTGGKAGSVTNNGWKADTLSKATLKLGGYNIFSGIPSMYIGHFELKEGGNYIVALSSDDNSYATGTYTFNAATSTIEWKTGFFWQKKWGGKLISDSHIEFNKSTYGDSKRQKN